MRTDIRRIYLASKILVSMLLARQIYTWLLLKRLLAHTKNISILVTIILLYTTVDKFTIGRNRKRGPIHRIIRRAAAAVIRYVIGVKPPILTAKTVLESDAQTGIQEKHPPKTLDMP